MPDQPHPPVTPERFKEVVGVAPDAKLSFEEHKEITAMDCESIAKDLMALAAKVRQGNLKAFEHWWLEAPPDREVPKCIHMQELIVLRYLHREERVTAGA